MPFLFSYILITHIYCCIRKLILLYCSCHTHINSTPVYHAVGFLSGLQPRNNTDVKLHEITLMKCLKPATMGAAYLASQTAGIQLAMDFAANVDVFYSAKLK